MYTSQEKIKETLTYTERWSEFETTVSNVQRRI